MKKTKHILVLLSAFLCTILLLNGTACAPKFEYYIAYTQDQGIAHYTFAYPNNYNVKLVQLFDDEQYSCIDIVSVMDKYSRTKTSWQIEVSKDKYINVSDALAQKTLNITDYSNVEYFKPKTIYIDGNEATTVSFMCNHSRTYYETEMLNLQPATYVHKYIAFEKDGYIWLFTEEYSPQSQPQDWMWFKNLIDTIKIF